MVVKYVNLIRMVLVHFGCFGDFVSELDMCGCQVCELDMYYGSIALWLLLGISYAVNYVHFVENFVICVVIYMLRLSIYIVMLSFLKIQMKCC